MDQTLPRAGDRLLPLVVAVGLIGGLAGAAFVEALLLLQRALWPSHHGHAVQLAILVGVGAAVGLITHFLGSPGDVELLVDNIHVSGGREDISDLRSLLPVSLLCVSSGGGMGPEAPLVQTTGSLGSWLGRHRQLGTDGVRILTITGLAAGFTVLFGAPLGSAVFALEILHRRGLQYHEALLPAIIGSLAGYAVYAVVTGLGLQPVWHFPGVPGLRPVDLLWACAAGVAGALVAATFTFASVGLRWAFRRVPPAVRPVLGGLALGGLGFLSPYALTYGETQVNPLLAHHGATHGALALTFLAAAGAKLAGTTTTLASGWRGGFIIPLFFIGVALGRLGHALVPGANEVVLMTAVMAAANVGVTKTPIGSTIIVSEMAGLKVLPTTMLASVVALYLTSQVALIETQREREGAYDSPPVEPAPTGVLP